MFSFSLLLKDIHSFQDLTGNPGFYQWYWLIPGRCLVKRRCVIEYHQRRNEIGSYDNAKRQLMVLYKVGTGWVQGHSLGARHICACEIVILPID